MKGRGLNTDQPPLWQARSQRTLAGDYLMFTITNQTLVVVRSEGGGSGSGLRKFESRASLNTTGTNESPAMASKFGSSFTVNKHKKVYTLTNPYHTLNSDSNACVAIPDHQNVSGRP